MTEIEGLFVVVVVVSARHTTTILSLFLPSHTHASIPPSIMNGLNPPPAFIPREYTPENSAQRVLDT